MPSHLSLLRSGELADDIELALSIHRVVAQCIHAPLAGSLGFFSLSNFLTFSGAPHTEVMRVLFRNTQAAPHHSKSEIKRITLILQQGQSALGLRRPRTVFTACFCTQIAASGLVGHSSTIRNTICPLPHSLAFWHMLLHPSEMARACARHAG